MESYRPFPETEAAAAALAALGSQARLSVLRTLVRAGPGGIPIGTLADRSGITGSTLTFHVKILAQAGLVRRVRDGRHILCAAEKDALRRLGDFLLAGCCADSAAPAPDRRTAP